MSPGPAVLEPSPAAVARPAAIGGNGAGGDHAALFTALYAELHRIA